MHKNNITVSRYSNPAAIGYQCAIAPDDRQWVLFVALDGKASLWNRVSATTESGDSEERYEPVATMS